MAERPDQIEQHIASKRYELGSNLQELEQKVKQAADWRTYYERNPMTMVALAFGGGVLLAMAGDNSGRSRGFDRSEGVRSEGVMVKHGQRSAAAHGGQMNETWRNLKAAVVGMAGMRVREMLNEALPGFTEHYDKVAREHASYTPAAHVQHEYESSAHRM